MTAQALLISGIKPLWYQKTRGARAYGWGWINANSRFLKIIDFFIVALDQGKNEQSKKHLGKYKFPFEGQYLIMYKGYNESLLP